MFTKKIWNCIRSIEDTVGITYNETYGMHYELKYGTLARIEERLDVIEKVLKIEKRRQ